MNIELMKKWIVALRSGNYKQDMECLRSVYGFCCLGVLCDVVDSEAWKLRNEHEYQFNGFEIDLPLEIAKEVGLTQIGMKTLTHQPYTDAFIFDGDFYTSLAGANDSGISFSEIADALENYMNDYLENLNEQTISN